MIVAITVNQAIFQKIWDHSSSTNITGYKADEFAAMSYCWVSCNLWPWWSRHEYQDYCHHGEPGLIHKNPIHDGMARLEQTVRFFLEAYNLQGWGRLDRIRFEEQATMWDLLLWLLPSRWARLNSKNLRSLFIQKYHWLQGWLTCCNELLLGFL